MKTSLYTVLCIVIRLGAVILGMATILALPNIYFVAHTAQAGAESSYLLALLYVGVLIVALCLWLYPNVLASLAAGKATKEVFESPISAHTLQYVAFSVLGVWLVLEGLVALVFEIFRWATFSITMLPGQSVFTTELPRFASAVAQTLFGFALVLGAKGLMTLVDRFRYGSGKWEDS